MINTYVLQEFFKASDNYGFSISVKSGFCRVLAYRAQCPVEDVVESLNYALKREWIRESGIWGSDVLYSIVEGAQYER